MYTLKNINFLPFQKCTLEQILPFESTRTKNTCKILEIEGKK